MKYGATLYSLHTRTKDQLVMIIALKYSHYLYGNESSRGLLRPVVRSVCICVLERPRTFGNTCGGTHRLLQTFANSRERTREVVRICLLRPRQIATVTDTYG